MLGVVDQWDKTIIILDQIGHEILGIPYELLYVCIF